MFDNLVFIFDDQIVELFPIIFVWVFLLSNLSVIKELGFENRVVALLPRRLSLYASGSLSQSVLSQVLHVRILILLCCILSLLSQLLLLQDFTRYRTVCSVDLQLSFFLSSYIFYDIVNIGRAHLGCLHGVCLEFGDVGFDGHVILYSILYVTALKLM